MTDGTSSPVQRLETLMFVSGGPYRSDQVSDNVRTVEMDTANGSDVVVGHLHGEAADGTEVLFIDGMHLDP